MAGGKARNISPRNQPDPRFYNFMDNIAGVLVDNINNTQENKSPNNRYLKLRGGVMEGIIGMMNETLTISSGILYIWKDDNGNDIIPRAFIKVQSEGGSAPDTLDLIDMNDMEIKGARITLWGLNSAAHAITITHNATASGTGKNIYCPGDVDFVLQSDNMIDLIWDGSRWIIVQSSHYGYLEVETNESTEADIRLYRNDSTPNDNNVLGQIIWSGEDSAGNKTDYAEISGVSEDVTNGTEDGTMRLRVLEGGTMVTPFEIDGSAKEFNIRDTYNFAFSTSTGTQIGTASGQKIGFWGVTPVIQRSAYTVTNHVTDRAYDANSTTVAELADVLGTLITDLRSIGIVQ